MSKILKLSVLLVALAVTLPVFAANDEPPQSMRECVRESLNSVMRLHTDLGCMPSE